MPLAFFERSLAMFKSSVRMATLGTLTGILALGGCAASSQTQHVSMGAVSETPAPAMPRVNTAVAERLASNALRYEDMGIQLGAGDRFGRQMHDSYMVAVRLREHNRMLAEVY